MSDSKTLAKIRDIIFDNDMWDSEKVNEIKHILDFEVTRAIKKKGTESDWNLELQQNSIMERNTPEKQP